jgi:NAD(P)-dependent dehydrogenase (short-subunit alcohol dehydrogenase family)
LINVAIGFSFAGRLHQCGTEHVSSTKSIGDNLMKSSTLLKIAGTAVGAALASRLLNHKPYNLKDKVVLITGGSRGLGLVLAREFQARGAKVAICARDAEELLKAEADLQARGGALAIQCDVTNKTQVEEMVDTVIEHFGRIDVLVNNAGAIQVGPIEVMTPADFHRAMDTHFWGPLNTIFAVLPSMRERGDGRIVNISSVGGKIAVPHLVPYCASKFALVGLSKGLRAELAKDGILITTACPGLMRTGSPRNADFKGNKQAEYAWFSISDSLPFTSIQAERAARQIIRACVNGRAETVISIQAKAAVFLDQLVPETSAEIMALVNRLLPDANGSSVRQAKGKDSTSAWSPSLLTVLTEKAALRNNEVP